MPRFMYCSINGLTNAVSTIIMICMFTVSRTAAEQVVHLVEDKSDGIILNFKLPPYVIKDVIVNSRKCQLIAVSDAVYLSEKGAPRLPVFAQSFILPDKTAMALEIINISFREISANTIVPSKGVIYRNQNPAATPWIFGEVYTKKCWYPHDPAILGEPFILRDLRGAVVYFYPFQYNPALGKVRVAESITVKVKPAGGPVINPRYRPDKRISGAFTEIYRRRFINFNTRATRYPKLNDGEKMIVISSTMYKNSMKPFVEWKNRTGIKTRLYEYPLETGGTGADSLKGFIQQKYDADTITYILLVGDAADIPSLTGSISGLSDPSFVKLAGNDNYPDAFIGRFSVETVSHADYMVDKVLQYEKAPEQGAAWYSKAIGMAGKDDGGTGVSDEAWMDEMSQMMMNTLYTRIDKVYESANGTTSQVVSALNEGRGWFNYQGHGLQTSFGYPGASIMSGTFKTVKNTDMPPVIICVSCYAGEFDYKYECVAEAATRLDKTGAIAFLGSYIAQPFQPPQHGQKEIVWLLSENACVSLGAIVYNGGCKILEVGNSTGEYLETFETWTLFGDPSLLVFNSAPTVLTVTYPKTLPTGAQDAEITFGENIEGRVCLYSEENGILSSEIIANKASVKLFVTITNEKKIHLTITARNRMPVMEEITIGTDAIIETSGLKHSNKFMVKKIGNVLMLPVPFTESCMVTISDLQGKHIAELQTSADRSWYQIPGSFSSGMHIINIKGHDRSLARKLLFVR